MLNNSLSVDEVARRIAGDNPSAWLVEKLPIFISGIGSARIAEIEYPGRPETRKRLKAIAKAARLIHQELQQSLILSLVVGDQPWTPGENEKMSWLHDIASRAEAAIPEAEPVGRPSDKHWPRPSRGPARLAAKAQCALVVAIIWEKMRGTWPGLDNEDAWLACDGLWRAAGGNSIRDWSDHLEIARNQKAGTYASVILRDPGGGD